MRLRAQPCESPSVASRHVGSPGSLALTGTNERVGGRVAASVDCAVDPDRTRCRTVKRGSCRDANCSHRLRSPGRTRTCIPGRAPRRPPAPGTYRKLRGIYSVVGSATHQGNDAEPPAAQGSREIWKSDSRGPIPMTGCRLLSKRHELIEEHSGGVEDAQSDVSLPRIGQFRRFVICAGDNRCSGFRNVLATYGVP